MNCFCAYDSFAAFLSFWSLTFQISIHFHYMKNKGRCVPQNSSFCALQKKNVPLYNWYVFK